MRTDNKGKTLGQLLQIVYDGGKKCVLIPLFLCSQLNWCRDFSSRWFWHEREWVVFPELRTVVLIAVKYQVQAIIDEVVSRLSEYYAWRSLADASEFCDGSDIIHLHGDLCISTAWIALQLRRSLSP